MSTIIEMGYTSTIATQLNSTQINSSLNAHMGLAPMELDPTMAILFYVIGTIGIMGNSFAILVFFSSYSMRRRSYHVFIINQCFMDSMASVFLVGSAIPTSKSPSVILCKVWLSRLPLWSLMVASTYGLLALTIDRYMALVHPMWHRGFVTHKRRVVPLLVSPWLFGLAYNCVYMIPTTVIDASGTCQPYAQWPSETWRNAFGICNVLVQFFIPLILQIFCYGRIVVAICQQKNVIPKITKRLSTKTRPRHDKSRLPANIALADSHWSRAKKNTFKIAMLVSFSFVLCWSSNQILFTMHHLGHVAELKGTFYDFTVIATFSNCCVNPVIYSLQYESFQKAARRLFLRQASWHQHGRNRGMQQRQGISLNSKIEVSLPSTSADIQNSTQETTAPYSSCFGTKLP